MASIEAGAMFGNEINNEVNNVINNVINNITSSMNLEVSLVYVTQQNIAPPEPEPVEVPVIWDTNDLEVFTSVGSERFQQEIQSANNMMAQLSNTQNALASQAYNTNLIPPEAFRDLNMLAVRMDILRENIQQIENTPVCMRTDKVNASLEQLRSQLNTAVQEQDELNKAMQDMDVSAINSAYTQLSQTISGTERYIRDNISGQGRFNDLIQQGIQQANRMGERIRGIADRYINMDNLERVVNVSDEMTQTVTQLNRVNDGQQSTDELVRMVYAAAQDSRGSFGGMAEAVIGFGTEAGDAFDSSAEMVAFADLIQKQVAITGGDGNEASQVMQQLAGAFGSGEMSGSTLEGIFDKMPDMQQSIAGYLNVPVDQVSQLAEEGKISVDMVKAAVFASSEEINAKFEEMPTTWAQTWQSMQNGALIAFAPVLEGINDLANNEVFQSIVESIVEAMAMVGGVIGGIFGLVASVGEFIVDNWGIISPIIYGVIAALALYAAYLGITKAIELGSAVVNGAMTIAKILYSVATGTATSATLAETTAQLGLNSALLACPIVWIILLIIALIAIIFAVCSAIAKFTGVANSGFGVICGGINVAIQFFKNLALTVFNILLGIGNAIAALGSNIKAAFHNAICSVQNWWYDLLSDALTVISEICEALNRLPFVEFDYSGISSAADNYAARAAEASQKKMKYKDIGDAFHEGFNTFDTFKDGWMQDAFEAGASWGDGIADKISNFSFSDFLGIEGMPDPEDYTSKYKDILGDQKDYGMEDALANSGIGDNVGNISDNTGAIRDSVDISNEDLKYLRDVAEQEVINRFTLAEVNIDQSGMQNTINSGDDIDGFMTKLTGSVTEAVDSMAEGVHA